MPEPIERIAALEEHVRGMDGKLDAIVSGLRLVHNDVLELKLSRAEASGIRKAAGWLSHFAVGVGGVLATLFLAHRGG